MSRGAEHWLAGPDSVAGTLGMQGSYFRRRPE